MRLPALILFGVLGLSACTNYQEPQANCFDGGTVTRSKHNLNFVAAPNVVVSTRGAPSSDCTFEILEAPLGLEDQ